MKKARIIFLIVGIGLFGLLFAIFGIRKPIEQIIAFGWKFWLCVAIYFFNQICLTYGWMVLITPRLSIRRFKNVLLARIAGDSTTTISTAAGMAGDALKAIYLQDIVPLKAGLASVVMDRTIHMVGNTILILVGVFIGFFKLKLPLWSLSILFAFFALLLGGLFYVMRKQKSGFLAFIISKIPLPIRKRLLSPEREKKIDTLDEEIRFIFKSRENLNHFYISLFMHIVPVMLAGTLEVYIIMLYAGGSVTLIDSIFVYLFGLFITSASFFIPMGIGASEGSYSLVLAFLGYDPSLGITIGFLRRLRALVWSGFGLLLLFHKGIVGAKDTNDAMSAKRSVKKTVTKKTRKK
ncbi:MAG TPA: lysylphosphatidylglycerol synthase transmembrane domain-containing protein [Spirochaetota bacterium]